MAYPMDRSEYINIAKQEEEEWLQEHDQYVREKAIDEFISNVLAELNDIANDNDYYFDKDNADFVSNVLFGQFEKLKEKK